VVARVTPVIKVLKVPNEQVASSSLAYGTKNTHFIKMQSCMTTAQQKLKSKGVTMLMMHSVSKHAKPQLLIKRSTNSRLDPSHLQTLLNQEREQHFFFLLLGFYKTEVKQKQTNNNSIFQMLPCAFYSVLSCCWAWVIFCACQGQCYLVAMVIWVVSMVLLCGFLCGLLLWCFDWLPGHSYGVLSRCQVITIWFLFWVVVRVLLCGFMSSFQVVAMVFWLLGSF